ITTHSSPRYRNELRKLTMFSCRLSFITRISLMIRSFFGCCSRFICLTATTRLCATSYAVNTPPEALGTRMSGERGTRCRHRHRHAHPWPILVNCVYSLVGSSGLQMALRRSTMSSALCTAALGGGRRGTTAPTGAFGLGGGTPAGPSSAPGTPFVFGGG